MKATKQCVIYVSYSCDTRQLTFIILSVTSRDCEQSLCSCIIHHSYRLALNKHGLGASLSTANTRTYSKVLSCVANML